MSIDMKQEIIKRNLKGEVVQACYYALSDISQEINAVLQVLTATGNGSIKDIEKYARKMSDEDLKIIRKLLDTHSKNLATLAELLPDSGFPLEWSDDDVNAYNKLAETYKNQNKTIVSCYINEIIENHSELFPDD